MDYEQDARRALRAVGEQIRSNGLPAAFSPLVICVAGTGNVSRGAIDAIKALGVDVIEWVSAAEGHCDGLSPPLIAC